MIGSLRVNFHSVRQLKFKKQSIYIQISMRAQQKQCQIIYLLNSMMIKHVKNYNKSTKETSIFTKGNTNNLESIKIKEKMQRL